MSRLIDHHSGSLWPESVSFYLFVVLIFNIPSSFVHSALLLLFPRWYTSLTQFLGLRVWLRAAILRAQDFPADAQEAVIFIHIIVCPDQRPWVAFHVKSSKLIHSNFRVGSLRHGHLHYCYDLPSIRGVAKLGGSDCCLGMVIIYVYGRHHNHCDAALALGTWCNTFPSHMLTSALIFYIVL